MMQVPLECDINTAINGPFWVEVANPEHTFKAMLIPHSRGTCLIVPLLQLYTAAIVAASGFVIGALAFLGEICVGPTTASRSGSEKKNRVGKKQKQVQWLESPTSSLFSADFKGRGMTQIHHHY